MKAFYKVVVGKSRDNRDPMGSNINSANTDEHLALTFTFTVSNSSSVWGGGDIIFLRKK
jgi:hypothetical protein